MKSTERNLVLTLLLIMLHKVVVAFESVEEIPKRPKCGYFNCPHSNLFWKHLEKYYFNLTKQLKVLSLQEIIIGIIALSCPLLNYLILIGKVYIWDCRRKCVRPYIEGFILKIKTKYQIEKYIATKNNDLEAFYKKWTGNFPLLV